MIADIGDHLSYPLFIVWNDAINHIFCERVAENSSEILVTRERKETSTVSDHTNKGREN